MLKPYICVVCEKVVLEYQMTADNKAVAGPASLISLFQKITAVVATNAPPFPANAVAPREWSLYSSWDTEPGDELRNYVLCTQILYPNGDEYGTVQRIPVKPLSAGKRWQMIVRVLGFPIGQAGFYKILTWIEENDQRVVGPIEDKIEVEIIKQAEAPPVA